MCKRHAQLWIIPSPIIGKNVEKLMGKPLLNVLVLIGGGGGKFSKKSGKEAGS